MGLTLLLGPAGSGKTTYLYRELLKKAEHSSAFRAMVIVPEQFTMQTQRDLVELHQRHSFTNIDILSFDRLAYRVLEEQGGKGLTVLDDMGKLLVLRRAAARSRDELSYFGRNLDKAGFIGRVKSMLSELYQYRIDAEELKKLVEETKDEPLLSRKLREILTIYTAFDESMREDTIPSEKLLDVLCRLIPKSERVKDSVVFCDGFAGFTPVQFSVLEALMGQAREVIVTVTVDGELTHPENSKERTPFEKARLASDRQLFEQSLTTVRTLCGLAEGQGVPVRKIEDFTPGRRYGGRGALAALERQFLRCPVEPFATEEEENAIHLWEVKDRREEIQAVAREIFRLVREEDCRYREIALVGGDAAGYEPVIRQVFDRAGIPFFIDAKGDMMGHPLVAFLRGALEAVEKDYSYDTLFACLKSGLGPLTGEDLYELENYALAVGLRGRKAWSGPWEAGPGRKEWDMERMEGLRLTVMEPLLAFEKVLKAPESTVQDYAAATVTLMQSQHIEQKLKTMAMELMASGETTLSQEYGQAYDKVLALLDRVVELFGDGRISLREWREILDTGFSEIRVGVIPACADWVVVGDMRRTRLKDPKVVFFIGANDGIVPRAGESGSLLSDMDRRSLEKRGVHLAPTRQEAGFTERFYLYLTLARPSDRLYISWCRQSADGGSLNPSYLVGEIQEIFPALPVNRPDEEESLVARIVNAGTAKEALLRGLPRYRDGEEQPEWEELYRLFAEDPASEADQKRLLDAAYYVYREESIGPAVARALYGDVLGGSVTRLEQYAACAYAQFLSFGLGLKERRLHRFAPADMGTLFHEVLRRFFAKVYGSSGELPADEKRRQMVRDCLKEAVEDGAGRGLKDSARGEYLLERVERIADRTLWALCEQLKRGDFKPEEVEVDFDGRDSQAMNLVLGEDALMRLYGRIDRVDTCDAGDEVYVKVIDYKTGSTSLDLTGIYYGTSLQLVVYLDAAMEREEKKNRGKKVIPAGILYYNIRDPFISVEPGQEPDEKEIEEELLGELRMNGIVNRDRKIYSRMDHLVGTGAAPVIPVVEKDGQPVEKRSSLADTGQFDLLKRAVRERMRRFGREIMDGRLTVDPYIQGGRTSCDYCRFGAVCGFDRKTPGFGYRRLREITAPELWEQLKEEEAAKEKEAEGRDS